MSVDVLNTIEIDRPPETVRAFARDPDHIPQWYENILSVEWQTDRPARVGSQIAFVAQFMGRRLAYTYEIVEDADEQFVMRTAEGPFPMETTYAWKATPSGGTEMGLRNRGEPAGFSRLVAPFMVRAMRSATRKDLARLKQVLEAQ